MWNIKRLSSTNIVGDAVQVKQERQCIVDTEYICTFDCMLHGKVDRTDQIVPFVRKKSVRSRKKHLRHRDCC